MFCSKCGKKIDDDALFCPSCGWKVTEAGDASRKMKPAADKPAAPAAGKSPKSGWPIIIGALGVIVILAAVLLFLLPKGSGFGKTEIDLNDYFAIDSEGYNTLGTAYCVFDQEGYQRDIDQILQEKGIWENEKITPEAKMHAQELYATPFSYELDKTSGLSNGDEVTLTYTYNNDRFYDVGIAFKGESKTYVVDNLAPLKEFDPFENFEVVFSGTSPYCAAQYSGGYEGLSYIFDKSENLMVGETVTVSVNYLGEKDFNSFTERTGLIPSQTEKTYEVKDVDRYLINIADIPEDMRNSIDKACQNRMTATAADWDTPSSYKGMDFLGYYYLKPKKEGLWSHYPFYLYPVYRVNVEKADGQFFSFYRCWEICDVMILADGICTCDLDDIEPLGNYFYVDNLRYYGYQNLDSVFNECVTEKIVEYDYESTVQEKTKTSNGNSVSTGNEGSEGNPSTGNEGTGGGQSTGNEGTGGGQSTGNGGTGGGQPTGNEGTESGQPTGNEGTEGGQSIGNEGTEGGQSTGNEETEEQTTGAATQAAPADAPNNYYYYAGHTYAFYDADGYGLDTYAKVADFCRKQGGYLAVINDADENAFLFDKLSSNYDTTAFFGYTDADSESDWSWTDRDSDYTNWTVNSSSTQPDNGAGYGGDEDYAEFAYEKYTDSPNDGTWNDAPFMNNTGRFICEWDYEIAG